MSMLLALAALPLVVPCAAAGAENAEPATPAPAGEAATPGATAPERVAGAEGAIRGDDAPPAAGDAPPAAPPPSGADRTKRRGPRGGPPPGDRPPGERPPGEGSPERGPMAGVWRQIRPVGLLQVWGTAWDMDEDPVADATGIGDPEDDVGFKVKRFRLGLAGEAGRFDWALVLGSTAPYDGFDDEAADIEVIDAHVGYGRRGFGVKVGKDEVPFSRDRMIGSSEQTFQERGMLAEHIAPGRELGASAWAERFGAKITLGVFNSGGGLYGDDNLGKTLLGRAEYTFGDADVYETWGGDRSLSFGVGGGAFYTDDVATSTLAFGADGIVRVAGLTVLVDAALATVRPTNTTLDVPGVWDETTRRGLTGQLGYGLGAFEPAVKVSLYEDSAIGGYTTLLGGVVWHGAIDDARRDRVRIGAGYQLRLEESAIDNDTVRVWAQVRP